MDVEGAENQIVPELLRAEGASLVDVLMWECHLKWRGEPGRCKCAILASLYSPLLTGSPWHSPLPLTPTFLLPLPLPLTTLHSPQVRCLGGGTTGAWRGDNLPRPLLVPAHARGWRLAEASRVEGRHRRGRRGVRPAWQPRACCLRGPAACAVLLQASVVDRVLSP